MTVSIQTLLPGDTGYIPKHNSNYANLKAAIEALDALLGGALGAALSTAEAFQALFGTSVAVVASGSYLCHGAGSTLTVDAGFCWLPASSLMVEQAASSTLSFTGLAAATYYVVVDTTGTPSRSASSTDAIYSVVWTGAAFGAITRVANLVWAAADWTAAQVSAALGASYETLDARLEAGETIVKANQTAIATYGTGATLIKDIDGTLAANSDLRVATQKAVKAYVDANIGGLTDAFIFKSDLDCSANPNYPAANAGDVYKVSVAGKVGGGAGPNVEVFDSLYCKVDGSAAGNHATVGANWVIFQGNLDIDIDGTLAANSDAKVATQKAVKTYVDAQKLFDMYAFCPGVPSASQLMLKAVAGRAATIPDDFAGSYADAEVAATASTVFTVKKNGASVGTITFGVGATTGTFVTTGTTVALAAGDKLTIVGPVTPDATLADISFTILAART